MSHTPGPWKVEDRRKAPIKNIRIVGNGGHEVAEVSDVHQRDHLSPRKWSDEEANAIDAEGLANAQLIAAAPDLLAACKLLIDAGEGCVSLVVVLDAVWAAIAKAEPNQDAPGKTPG
jgi:hypothetical protein